MNANTHEISERRGPGIFIVMCSCGARQQFARRNALARAAKARAWVRKHFREVESSSHQTPIQEHRS